MTEINLTEIIKEYHLLSNEGRRVICSGSFFICGTSNTDVDFFMLDNIENRIILKDLNYRPSFKVEEYAERGFYSFRKSYFNTVLIKDEEELDNVALATDICSALKLKDKQDRIMVFKAIREKCFPTEYISKLSNRIQIYIPPKQSTEAQQQVSSDDISLTEAPF